MRALLPAPLRALALILAVLAVLWPRAAVTPLSSYDQRFYLGIAFDLHHLGRFTDGFAYAGGGPDTRRPPGMRFTPLYPGFLAAVARIDPGLRRGIDCVERSAGRDPACPRAAPVARAAQWLMLAGFYWLLWASIGRVSGSARAGWIGLALALVTAPLLLGSVNTLMTETMSLLLSAGACVLAAEAAAATGLRAERAAKQGQRLCLWNSAQGRALRIQFFKMGLRRPQAFADRAAKRIDRQSPALLSRTAAWWLASGLVLGLAILSRPAFLYLLWGGLAAGALVLLRTRSARLLSGLAALAAGTGIIVLPWVLRNVLVLHRAALSFGYASHTLIQRIAFDAMTPREYGLSFVCWLPDGSGLGKLIAGAHACDRFGWDEHPDSFYSIGTGPLMRASLAASGGWANHMHYIVGHYLLADFPRQLLWHLLVSIPLALRGLCIDHYWGLLLAPVSLLEMRRAARRGDAGVLLLSLPAWFLLGFNALVAVNQPRYNLLLILPCSLAGGMLIDRLLRRRDPVA